MPSAANAASPSTSSRVDWDRISDGLRAELSHDTRSGVYRGAEREVTLQMARWTSPEERGELVKLGLSVSVTDSNLHEPGLQVRGTLKPGASLATILEHSYIREITAG